MEWSRGKELGGEEGGWVNFGQDVQIKPKKNSVRHSVTEVMKWVLY